MKPTQVSTNVGTLTILSGVMNIFQNVKVDEIASVFVDLTCGQVISMMLPILVGLWGILHNEVKR